MSRHYKPGQTDDLEFLRPLPDGSTPVRLPDEMAEAHDDPHEDIEDQDAPEDDDDRAGLL
jgi:hypothetical protein